MKNYNNSKIYKIQPTCEHDEGDIYIGSTNRQYLCQRMAAHKSDYRKHKANLCNKLMSFDIFDKYGINNVEIALIELVNANSKDELTKRERFYIESTNCVNKCVPGRTPKEYYVDNKDKKIKYQKEYDDFNKDKKKEYNKQYRENNKEMINEKRRKNRANLKLKKAMEI